MTKALTIWTFVSKIMSLLFNTLARFVISFLPRSKRLLISWLQSLSSVILELNKIKSVTVSLMVQRLRICISNVGGASSIPGEGIKIPHATWPAKKKSANLYFLICIFRRFTVIIVKLGLLSESCLVMSDSL